MNKVDNAVILAAGASSRFAPLSYEIPKGLVEVKGELLIERLIRQLREKNIKEIIVVTGYKGEEYEYLKEKFDIDIIVNDEYAFRNNNSSIYMVRKYLKNTYICPVDNYYIDNPFNEYEKESYYSVQYSKDYINEWCTVIDESKTILKVIKGDSNCRYMAGFTFWNEIFSNEFVKILENVYENKETKDKFWEDIYLENVDRLNIKIKDFPNNFIKEFDSLNDLREFDKSYIKDTRSSIIKEICSKFNWKESDLKEFEASKKGLVADGFYFKNKNEKYHYDYASRKIEKVD